MAPIFALFVILILAMLQYVFLVNKGEKNRKKRRSFQRFAQTYGYCYTPEKDEKLIPAEISLNLNPPNAFIYHSFSSHFGQGKLLAFERRYVSKRELRFNRPIPKVCHVVLIESDSLPDSRISLYPDLKWFGHMKQLGFDHAKAEETVWMDGRRHFSIDYYVGGPSQKAIYQFLDSELLKSLGSLSSEVAVELFPRYLVLIKLGELSLESFEDVLADGEAIFKQLAVRETDWRETTKFDFFRRFET